MRNAVRKQFMHLILRSEVQLFSISFMFIYNLNDMLGAWQTINIYIGFDLYSSATSLTTHTEKTISKRTRKIGHFM